MLSINCAGCLPWQREVVYSLPLKSRLGPEHAHNVETQELRTFYGNGWNVHVTTLTPNVPLGSTFHTATHYEARQLGHGVTELHISAELVFKRKAIGLLKGTITSAWQKGTHRTYEIKKELLREAFPEGRPGEVPENGGDVHHVREAEGHVAVKVSCHLCVASCKRTAAMHNGQRQLNAWHRVVLQHSSAVNWRCTPGHCTSSTLLKTCCNLSSSGASCRRPTASSW